MLSRPVLAGFESAFLQKREWIPSPLSFLSDGHTRKGVARLLGPKVG